MKLKLATLFTDNMVIQRGEPLKIFGTAEEGGALAVRLCPESDPDRVYAAYTEEIGAGTFCAVFPEVPDTRETLVMTVLFNDEPAFAFRNVVLGEVWIAGGQSNMEMPLFTTYDGFEDAEKLSDPNIRLFTVPRRPFPDAHIHNWHFEDVASEDTPWQVCTPEAALHFTAAGFHFARKILDDCRVPVGVISCNWGGTCVETWMDFETVETIGAARDDEEAQLLPPGADAKAVYYKKVMETIDMEKYVEKYEQWQASYMKAVKDSDAVRDAREQGADGFARHSHTGSVDVHPDYGPWNPNRPGCLYENMVARIAPYPVKGVLWYQGESNGGKNESMHYARLFTAMVSDWRWLWGMELPFLVVEIAPFFNVSWNGTPGDAWGYLREQQRIADDDPANAPCALIQIGDAGDMWNIHPCSKKVVGERLALAAERVAYHMLAEYSGPVFSGKVRAADGGLYVSFRCCAGGLAVRGDKLTDFCLCGSDGEFRDAEAEIVSEDTVFVHSAEVPEPVYVRAGFRDYPLLNLTNGKGLPASPFRTDTFA